MSEIAGYLVKIICKLADEHPAYFEVFDSTKQGTLNKGSRERIRLGLAELLSEKQPKLDRSEALEVATVCVQLVKSIPQLYMAAATKEKRAAVVREYTIALSSYMTTRTAVT